MKNLTYNQKPEFVRQVAKKFVENGLRSGAAALRAVRPNVKFASSRVIAHHVLTSLNGQKAVREELEAQGLTNEHIDKRLKQLVDQDDALPTALGAVIETNKLKDRYPKNETEHRHLHLHLTQDEIDKKLLELDEELKILA